MPALRFQKRRLKQQRRMARKAKRGKSQRLSPQPRWLGSAVEGIEKMSEALSRFVEPLAKDAPTEAAYRKLLSLGMLAWNAAIVPELKSQELIDSALRAAMPDAPLEFLMEAKGIVRTLVARKRSEFAYDDRYIVGFELYNTGTCYSLQVASLLGPPDAC